MHHFVLFQVTLVVCWACALAPVCWVSSKSWILWVSWFSKPIIAWKWEVREAAIRKCSTKRKKRRRTSTKTTDLSCLTIALLGILNGMKETLAIHRNSLLCELFVSLGIHIGGTIFEEISEPGVFLRWFLRELDTNRKSASEKMFSSYQAFCRNDHFSELIKLYSWSDVFTRELFVSRMILIFTNMSTFGSTAMWCEYSLSIITGLHFINGSFSIDSLTTVWRIFRLNCELIFAYIKVRGYYALFDRIFRLIFYPVNYDYMLFYLYINPHSFPFISAAKSLDWA